jgi:hypothetical protein
MCCKWQALQNLSRNLSLSGGFLPHPIQRVPWTSVTLLPVTRRAVLVCTTPVPGQRRFPVQTSTPLGPDQVNVLLLTPI